MALGRALAVALAVSLAVLGPLSPGAQAGMGKTPVWTASELSVPPSATDE